MGKKGALQSLLLWSYRRQGAGGPSRLSGLPGDGSYLQHSMAVSAPICTLQGFSLCGWGTFLQTLCTVAKRKASRIAAHFIGEVLDTTINTSWGKGGCESLYWCETCKHFPPRHLQLSYGSDTCFVMRLGSMFILKWTEYALLNVHLFRLLREYEVIFALLIVSKYKEQKPSKY